MRHLYASTVLLFVSALLPAQNAPSIPKLTLWNPPGIQTCPVSLFAQRQSTEEIARVGSPAQDGPAQSLHITVDHQFEPAIKDIEITVHGLKPEARIYPIATASSPEVTKAFQFHSKPESPGLTEFNVSMHHVGALRWVQITAIIFADGSTWHPFNVEQCSVVPSLYMPVDATAQKDNR
jgi:hypothetical protein